jgi:hypothetical protein
MNKLENSTLGTGRLSLTKSMLAQNFKLKNIAMATIIAMTPILGSACSGKDSQKSLPMQVIDVCDIDETYDIKELAQKTKIVCHYIDEYERMKHDIEYKPKTDRAVYLEAAIHFTHELLKDILKKEKYLKICIQRAETPKRRIEIQNILSSLYNSSKSLVWSRYAPRLGISDDELKLLYDK